MKIETNVVKPEIRFSNNDLEYRILSVENESNLDGGISNIEKYIDQSGKGKSEDEKDELYKNAQNLWQEYAESMKTVKYNFHLNRPQWKFLTDLILSKLEYDVNTVFFAIELTSLLATLRDVKYANDTDMMSVDVTATEITYVYHLISKHKIKGLTKDAYMFSEILMTIGSISKVINYYDAVGKNLSNDIQNWVSSFEEGVSFEKSIVGEKLEPTDVQ
jgi:hypothetical protein